MFNLFNAVTVHLEYFGVIFDHMFLLHCHCHVPHTMIQVSFSASSLSLIMSLKIQFNCFCVLGGKKKTAYNLTFQFRIINKNELGINWKNDLYPGLFKSKQTNHSWSNSVDKTIPIFRLITEVLVHQSIAVFRRAKTLYYTLS